MVYINSQIWMLMIKWFTPFDLDVVVSRCWLWFNNLSTQCYPTIWPYRGQTQLQIISEFLDHFGFCFTWLHELQIKFIFISNFRIEVRYNDCKKLTDVKVLTTPCLRWIKLVYNCHHAWQPCRLAWRYVLIVFKYKNQKYWTVHIRIIYCWRVTKYNH